jgi:hypothetical protein
MEISWFSLVRHGFKQSRNNYKCRDLRVSRSMSASDQSRISQDSYLGQILKPWHSNFQSQIGHPRAFP